MIVVAANAILVVLMSFCTTSLVDIKLILISSKSLYISLILLGVLLGSKIAGSEASIVRSKEEEDPKAVEGQEFTSFFTGSIKRTRSGFHGFKLVWHQLLLMLYSVNTSSCIFK